MRTIYIIFAWTGWVWLAIAGGYLYSKLRRKPVGDPNTSETSQPK
jgi:hypothetical protein